MDQANADNPQEKLPLVRLKVHVYTCMGMYLYNCSVMDICMYMYLCTLYIRTDCFVHVSKIHLYMFIENNKVCM